jgi:hypothetical protein
MTATTRGVWRLISIGALLVASSTLTGCWSNSAMLTYEYEAHNQLVSDWCSRHGLGRTPEFQEDCVRRVWQGVPPSACADRPCTDQFNSYYGRRGIHE